MDILLIIHSAIRWAIIVLAALVIVKYSISLAANSAFQGMDRGLAGGFSGLMDLQALIGLIYFIWNGAAVTGFPFYRILHGFIMLFAIVAAHLPARLKTLPDKLRFQYSLLVIIVSLILVLIGISLLPHGWG